MHQLTRHFMRMMKAAAGGPEDFTTYLELDPANTLSTTATVAAANITALTAVDCYQYKDSGVGYWTGLITNLFTLRNNSFAATGVLHFIASFTNELGAVNASATFPANLLSAVYHSDSSTTFRIGLAEISLGVFGSVYTPYNKTINTDYFLKLVRDPTVGAFGTAYLYIYTDAARTVLTDTLTFTLRDSIKNYRYNYAFQAYTGSDPRVTGTISDMTITKT